MLNVKSPIPISGGQGKVPKTLGKGTTKDSSPLVGYQKPCDLPEIWWQRNKRETDNSTDQHRELTWDNLPENAKWL